jgi:hypothetical protein
MNLLILTFFVLLPLSAFSQIDAQAHSIPVLTALAATEGHLEWRMYNNGYRGTGPKIFGWLRANYHPVIGLKWATFCVLLNEPEFFPAFTVIEDIAFQLSAGVWPNEKSWISKLGGVRIGRVFIPVAYLIGAGLTIILYTVLG